MMGQGVAGCQSRTTLQILLLKNTVPSQLVGKFRREITTSHILNFTPKSQLKELFTMLQDWQRPQPDGKPIEVPDANLVMIGDYWLELAIRQKLIQPLDPGTWSEWSKLPAPWRQLVQRNEQGKIDPQGKIWAAPYLWGTTVIAYRQDKFQALGWTPSQWKDLWQPELRGRISLPDQLREVIGLTLKKLGHSYNTADLTTIPNLAENLTSLRQQVKFYSSDRYLQPLITGDTWLAVGYSHDLISALKNQSDLGVVIPAPGTALWADLWVKPQGLETTSEMNDLINQWINFSWRSEIGSQLSLLVGATSPIVNQISREQLPKGLQNNSLLFPDGEILAKSEFLEPLSETTIAQYRQLWSET